MPWMSSSCKARTRQSGTTGLFLAAAVLTLSLSGAEGTKSNLTLAVFITAFNDSGSFTGGDNSGRPFLETVQMAVELVNQDHRILPGYHLDYKLTDSQCQAGPSVRGYIDQIFMEPTKIMIVGADCSTSTEPVAELAPFWNLVQISPLSSSPGLSDTDTFSTFTRVASSDEAVAVGVVNLMVRFNWTRVSVISLQERIFTSTFARLREELRQANITVDPREFTLNPNEDPMALVNRVYNSPSRIIFLNLYPPQAQEIICLAYMSGMTIANGYVWVLFAWYPANWWMAAPVARPYRVVTCSNNQLETVLQSSFLIDHYAFVEDKNAVTDVNLTRNQYDQQLLERLGGVEFSLSNQAQFYFDSVWAAARALDLTSRRYDLTNFTYNPDDGYSVELSKYLLGSVKNLSFLGLSGPVSFNQVGDRKPLLRFFQYQRNGSGVLFREYVGNAVRIQAQFPNGNVPQDEQFAYINIGLFIVYTILSCVGVAFAITCLAINIYFREKKVVKLTSPYLNVLIICGIIMLYVDVILFGIDEGTPVSRCSVNALCMLRLWIASIAFSLVFGTIFAKTWRVYYVFYSSHKHKQSKKSLIQDHMLFIMVGVLVVIDIIFMTFVTAFDSSRLSLIDRELPSNAQPLSTIVGLCYSQNRFVWLSILFVYKGILLIIGIFLAFETRKVKIRHLNDSKVIGIAVYCIVVLSIVLSATGVLLETYVDVYYAVLGIMILLGNSSILCLIFIPKFYGLWKDPDGLNIMKDTSNATTKNSDDAKEAIMNLNKEIARLKNELAQLDVNGPSQDTVSNDKEVRISFANPNGSGSQADKPVVTMTKNPDTTVTEAD